MVKFQPHLRLPTSAELPCSDDTPLDNEEQNFLPNFLLFLLEFIWADRNDWFFGIDMGIYHTTGVSHLVPVIPDGFLSLGVERRKGGNSRLSYVLWEEKNIVPKLALEVVSKTPGDEYDSKLKIYANLGVLYYIIYNPQYWRRNQHQPFEVYKLVDTEYQLQIGEPYWMPEIGLGIGRSKYTSGTIQREVLYWYDQNRTRYQTQQEVAQSERQRRELAEQQRERLAAKLRELGINPDDI
ncbi:MAG: Uma2 family endonuclease [Iphinoe sp. HA4291-MV1]|jgi:Uma2 family endonuclease|nr:Uma2 family endonuclease [Iphinoe sp. HA4291-MV1]